MLTSWNIVNICSAASFKFWPVLKRIAWASLCVWKHCSLLSRQRTEAFHVLVGCISKCFQEEMNPETQCFRVASFWSTMVPKAIHALSKLQRSVVPKGQETKCRKAEFFFSYVFRSGQTATLPLEIRGMYKRGFGSPILQREKDRLTGHYLKLELMDTIWNACRKVVECRLMSLVSCSRTKHIARTYSPPCTCVGSECRSWWKWAGLSTSTSSRLWGFTKHVCTPYYT